MGEEFNTHFEKPDRWRSAILKEREYPDKREAMLQEILLEYKGERDNALILGDASLVQSNFLLNEEGFEKVTNVDSSPSLMDDDIIKISDQRLERVLKQFDTYEPPANTFNLIYGKSIAFNSKETTNEVLQKLAISLKEDGVFYAIWGMDGDSYREGISYSEEELRNLYSDANLKNPKN